MADYTEALIGIDAAKLRSMVAIANARREAEVRFVGEGDAFGHRHAARYSADRQRSSRLGLWCRSCGHFKRCEASISSSR